MSKLSEAQRQPLADKELRVLEEIGGQRICEQRGAAYNQALEALIGSGYVTRDGSAITPAGRKALEDS